MKSNKLEINTLASKYPSIAEQWHPTLNGDVTPHDIKPNTKVKYYWLLPYDDEKTGKHFDFAWKASPNERVNGTGCPYLAGKAVWIGYNDLATTHPHLIQEWHPWRNGDLTPTDVSRGKRLKVWWYLPYDDPVLGHYDFEWQAWIADRAKGAGCPFLTGNAVWPGFNDLATRALWMAKQWHPTKNGDLKPTDITCNHHKKVWWLYPYDNPVLGHFNFEWKASPNTRMTEPGCPFLEGNGVWPGYNDLLTRYPLVASQFHPTKNGKISPGEISFASNKTYWWFLPYDDPVLGHYDFEWKAKVVNRTLLGEGCPYIGNDKVRKGYNDLLSRMPHIAREWHDTKNRRLRPDEVYTESTKKVWWRCSCCGHEWFGSIRGRTVNGTGCKKCHRNAPFIL